MKVGDLIKVCARTGSRYTYEGKVGVIVSSLDGWNDDEEVWGVLFGAHVELMFESALELVNESR